MNRIRVCMKKVVWTFAALAAVLLMRGQDKKKNGEMCGNEIVAVYEL